MNRTIRPMATGGTRALDELRRAGVAHEAHEYEAVEAAGQNRKRRPSYGDDAAAALGLDPARIHKTLVVSVDGRFAVAVVAVAAELDLKAFADALRGRKATMAEPADAERATGYVRGGISPLGQRRRLPTVVDAAAGEWPTIYVSAGRRGLQVELAPADLIRLTAAISAPIARR
ncbi:MAG: Cys-tRNA(Pro) deacylase [Chloroflexota bacterium]